MISENCSGSPFGHRDPPLTRETLKTVAVVFAPSGFRPGGVVERVDRGKFRVVC